MLRLGIIGCGRVTTMFHLKAIKGVEEVTVTAVADRNRKRMEKVKGKSGAERGYIDYRELLSDPDVDAVTINTPPQFHEAMVVDSLRADKHVQCEKPLARCIEGCHHIKSAQRATGLVVLPVHNYAFTPCLATAQDVIQSGEIGKIERIWLRFDNNLRSYGSKTDFRLERRFGIVEDILPHVLSVVHAVAGFVSEVEKARGWMKSYKVIDNLSLILMTNSGVGLDCSMNWTSLIPGFKMGIVGKLGRIEMELMKHPFRVSIESPRGKRKVDKKGLMKYLDILQLKHPSFRRQYRHFAGLVKGSEAPRFTVDDEIGMLQMMMEVVGHLSETPIS